MITTCLSSIGLLLTVTAFLTNITALCLMRKEKLLQAQRDLITCINVSRVFLCIVNFLWWLAWIGYHGRGFQKGVDVIYDGMYLFYVFMVIGMTIDRLVEVTAPLQYKATPVEHIHRLFVLLSLVAALMMMMVYSLSYKQPEVRSYTTLALDGTSVLINTVCYGFIRKRWNKRMKLAKKIGAIGRALQRLDTKIIKIGFFVALCATLNAIADMYATIIEQRFPANRVKIVSGLIVLFTSCLNILQPCYCMVIGVDVSVKDIKQTVFGSKYRTRQSERSQSLFQNRQPSWANL